MKLISIYLRVDNWFVDIVNIKDAPGFLDIDSTHIDFTYQASLKGLVDNEGHADVFGLGYGNSIQDALVDLRSSIQLSMYRAEIPDKPSALDAISTVSQHLAS